MIALLVKYLIDEDTEHLIREGLWRRQPSIDIKVIGELDEYRDKITYIPL